MVRYWKCEYLRLFFGFFGPGFVFPETERVAYQQGPSYGGIVGATIGRPAARQA